MQDEDPVVARLRRAHRDASDALDERPDAGVRRAVLAAAARGVDAKPRSIDDEPAMPAKPAQTDRRWLARAALVVVSVTVGMVATRLWRDAPEPTTTIASSASMPTPSAPSAPSSIGPTPVDPASTTMAPPASVAKPHAATPSSPPPSTAKSSTPRATRPADRHAASLGERVEVRPAPAGPDRSPASAFVAPPAPAAPPRETQAKAEGSSPTEIERRETVDASHGVASTRFDASRARIGRAAEPATPDAWVARIVALRAAGDDDGADRELDALRQRYPGYAIPARALRSTDPR